MQQHDIEESAYIVVGEALQIHKDYGPGMLESVYELLLAKTLESKGLAVERQKSIDIRYRDICIPAAFRLDLLVNEQLVIEIKSAETNHPLYAKQLYTYLKLLDQPLGLLLNFGLHLMKDGIQRVVNNHTNTTSSTLRIHRPFHDNNTGH